MHIDSVSCQFGLTLVTETIVYLVFLDWFRIAKSWKDLCFLLLINIFTWPMAFYSFNVLSIPFLVVESMVIITEWVLVQIYFRLSLYKSLIAAFFVNVASIVLGIVLF